MTHQHNEHPSQRNMEWVEAIVRWTRYEYVEIYEYPSTDGDPVMTVYTGDMVQVSRKFHRGDWCLCQVGHVLGWVFLKDVKFLVEGKRPRRRPRPAEQMNTNALDTQPTMATVYNEEDETQMPNKTAEPARAGAGATSKTENKNKPLIKRLINFFK